MKKLLLCAVLLSGCFVSEGPRRYPTWERTTHGVLAIAECAEADAWASKSGKEGLGVILELRGRSTEPCLVTIRSARLRVGTEEHDALRLPEPPTLRLGQRVRAYLAFRFDGDRAWNEQLEATLSISGPSATVTFPLKQTMASREECDAR